MQTLNEMRSLGLLTHEQHTEIVSWLMLHRTPEAIQAMPQHLWCALLQADALLYPGDDTAALH